MKLAFSSNAYLRFSIGDTIERIAALGYTGIELLADVPHAWPAGLLEEQKQAIRDALAKHRLTISNINAFMMNAVRSEERRVGKECRSRGSPDHEKKK